MLSYRAQYMYVRACVLYIMYMDMYMYMYPASFHFILFQDFYISILTENQNIDSEEQ